MIQPTKFACHKFDATAPSSLIQDTSNKFTSRDYYLFTTHSISDTNLSSATIMSSSSYNATNDTKSIFPLSITNVLLSLYALSELFMILEKLVKRNLLKQSDMKRPSSSTSLSLRSSTSSLFLSDESGKREENRKKSSFRNRRTYMLDDDLFSSSFFN